MQLFVSWEVFDTITDHKQIMQLREDIGERMQQLMNSGNVKTSGIFADTRGGFMILDLDSGEEVLEMLGSPILDHCYVRVRPIVSQQFLASFFEKQAGESKSAERRKTAAFRRRTE